MDGKKHTGTVLLKRSVLAICVTAAIALLFATGAAAEELGERKVCLGGFAVGLRFSTDGVLVTGVGSVISSGKEVFPATDAGIKAGDIITHINEEKTTTASAFAEAVEKCGESAELTILRGGQSTKITVIPAKEDVTGKMRLGITLKDSMSGIGTVTYYDPDTGEYGCLGHGICDSDTGVLMPLYRGSAISAEIGGVVKGKVGKPGEIKGYFLSERLGSAEENTLRGVFGHCAVIPEGNRTVSVADSSSVKEGKATILCTLGSDGVKEYEIEITKIVSESSETKNFTVKVTDPALIERTGGIVQGMSGSPVIQNGKLVGAVTHVLVNDPTSGYAIFIENMLETAN